ncbi:MAG: hypothetical protein ACK486_02275, partial [Cyanobacteriota bacterium]
MTISPSPSAATAAESSPGGDAGESNHRLSGGLPLVVLRRPGPAILAARLVIRGGSSRDPANGRLPAAAAPAHQPGGPERWARAAPHHQRQPAAEA